MIFYLANYCHDASERSYSGVFNRFANYTHCYLYQISLLFLAIVETRSEDAKILMSKICILDLILMGVAVTLTVIAINEHLFRSKRSSMSFEICIISFHLAKTSFL